jgi:NAD(P)-dependent dehydrogenase (short-subunit alcohol dehydrogenase family)
VIGPARSHAAEFGPAIRINAIAPGYVRTDMTDATTTPAERAERRAGLPVGRLGRPADVAAAAAYLRDAGFVTGATLDVNGGQTMR